MADRFDEMAEELGVCFWHEPDCNCNSKVAALLCALWNEAIEVAAIRIETRGASKDDARAIRELKEPKR